MELGRAGHDTTRTGLSTRLSLTPHLPHSRPQPPLESRIAIAISISRTSSSAASSDDRFSSPFNPSRQRLINAHHPSTIHLRRMLCDCSSNSSHLVAKTHSFTHRPQNRSVTLHCHPSSSPIAIDALQPPTKPMRLRLSFSSHHPIWKRQT
ncbi:hypothetical protein BLNAU_6014 [Blattamonas nauphoetae]|uniref:Uncharacterized protein n=1 Tax=Blattamonas nauphoetae TaxID=2049346 RepID=A0ABQ9Y5I8_9EUKA|nr:hypothetical protein BLNAU_6014 [Blattamonas nauphoetae]